MSVFFVLNRMYKVEYVYLLYGLILMKSILFKVDTLILLVFDVLEGIFIGLKEPCKEFNVLQIFFLYLFYFIKVFFCK